MTSSTPAAAAAAAAIPASARKTIHNLREIAGNHADDEIYAMLKECGMDPNETAQKLLLQDTFHEVKRKKDKRKEAQISNVQNNRVPSDFRWRPGSQSRGGGRGGRGNYPSRFVSQDGTGGRIINAVKENGVMDKSISVVPVSVTENTENNATTTISSSAAKLANGSRKAQHPISNHKCTLQDAAVSCTRSVKKIPSLMSRTETSSPHDINNSVPKQNAPTSNPTLSIGQGSVPAVYASSPDHVLGTSQVTHKSTQVASKPEVWSQKATCDSTIGKVVSSGVSGSDLSSVSGKGLSETSHPSVHENMPSKCQEVEVNQLVDTSQSLSSSYLSSSVGSRPSSSYSSHSQQCAPQSAAPVMEWKLKSTNICPTEASETHGPCDVEGDTVARSQTESCLTTTEDTISKLEKKLPNLQFSEAQHVIIPDHLHVSESERTGLSFGSFGALFGSSARLVNDSDNDKSSTHLSESSEGLEGNAEETFSSIQDESPVTQETALLESHTPELLTSREANASSTSPAPEYDQSKSEEALNSSGLQYSVVHTAPTYSNFGILPPMLGSQFVTVDGAEPQSRDPSRVTNFIQSFDPSTLYPQVYRPAGDGAHLPASAAIKYNGITTGQPTQSGQSPQEGGNSPVLTSTGPTQPVVSTAAASQQPLPVLRQPAGVHLSHFPPNFIPYNQYFSPFYIPPPTFPHFISNAPYPQLPQAGSMYPPSAVPAGAAPGKYSISQYKPPTNSGNPSPLPTGYGSYSPVSNGVSTGSEDLTSSQYKESNIYIAGQQNEGSAVWIPATGREVSALQPGSFYNLPQGQHMSFGPPPANGAFTGIYHPSQTVTGGAVHMLSQAMPGTVEMVIPPAGVYQQPQRAQINWNNNY